MTDEEITNFINNPDRECPISARCVEFSNCAIRKILDILKAKQQECEELNIEREKLRSIINNGLKCALMVNSQLELINKTCCSKEQLSEHFAEAYLISKSTVINLEDINKLETYKSTAEQALEKIKEIANELKGNKPQLLCNLDNNIEKICNIIDKAKEHNTDSL